MQQKEHNDLLSQLRYAVPVAKFSPPRLAASPYLFRTHLIREILQKQGQRAKIFLFEAQGGQGKTTLAAQYLYDSQHNFAWYQTGLEDRDPIFFLTAILLCLKEAAPSFSSPILEDMAINGEVNSADLARLANILLIDLRNNLTHDFFIVFDDLHLLEHCEQSLNLLDFLLKSSHPQLRFILLSRRPVALQSRTLRYGNEVLRLNNRDLSLSIEEADTLMTEILELKFQKDVVGEINRITDGWVMGVLMATRVLSLQKKQTQSLEEVRKSFTSRNIFDFFDQEIFAQIPDDYRISIMKLSLLEEVHLDLAVKITGDQDIGTKFCRLVDGNYFAKTNDKNDQLCEFHHLFREFLQGKANQELTAQKKREIYQTAIAHSIAGKRMAEALRYCLSAANYETMEQILLTDGLNFLATNRSATLLAILLETPPEIQFSHGWIALFIGLTFSEFSPEKGYEHLEQARNIFVASKEELGELLALSQLIFFYWVVAAALNTGALLLPRAEELFLRLEGQLPSKIKVVVAKNIAAGFCYFKCDMITARQYSSLARRLANKLQSKGLEAAVLLVQSYEHVLLGRRKQSLIELEKAYELLLDPHVASVYKMALSTLHIDDLQLHGDFNNYFFQKEQMLALLTQEELSQKTIVGPFLYVWDIGILVSQGKLREALAAMDEGSHSGPVAETPHMMSQFLHWKAYLLAHLDKPEAALKAARKSLLLREQAGGPFHEVLNGILLGTVFACLGMHDKAEKLLTQALSRTKEHRIIYLKAVCLLHRANAASLAGKIEAAAQDLKEGLRCMQENDYRYVPGLTPDKLERVLQIAVQHNIEAVFACDIARERLKKTFMKGGRVVPLLTIRMFDECQLELDGQLVMTTARMTPLQCRLLKLLTTAKNMKMRQEAIQLTFWPESPPEKSRSNFDSLLSRFRRSLRSAMRPYQVDDYFVLQQGILSLDNCELDVMKIRQMAREGLRHVNKNEWWQAANCFQTVLRLWPGYINTEVIEDDQVHDFVTELQLLLLKVVSTWSQYLISASREEQALVVLQEGLKIDPTEASLVRLTYHLHRKRGEMIKAKTLLQEYKQRLVAENYNLSEIQAIINLAVT
ncbi:MAG: hypothetical protein A2505_07525 [Deltaproteobacteria bacterium RIFOXYD12_FULL_55_16]|nr:MAG: hypothetical protein A2505_07525 [Deltaproteobacteria bacterium RIFOXYD12_FULL_55_16]